MKIRPVHAAEVGSASRPTKGNTSQEVLKGLLERWKVEEREREQKAKHPPPEEPLPDLSPKPHLVAFIDILGFGHQIEEANTEEDFQKLYRTLHFVQEAFDNPLVAGDPGHQVGLNVEYGRKVLALSDAVVVAITPNCPAGPMMGGYDLLGLALFDILTAQARCACRGIFLRGGISHGSFFYDEQKDILLSSALVRAYELESKYADYPIIIVPDSTRHAIFNVPKKGYYAPGADPTPTYFAKHDRPWKTKNNEPLYFLNYVGAMLNEQHQGWDPKDKRKYLEAHERFDSKRAQELIDRMAMKNAAYFLKWHRRRIVEAYTVATAESVRRKYRWLMNYHNRSFRRDLPYIGQQAFDMRKFRKWRK